MVSFLSHILTCPVESLFGKDPDVAEDVVDDKVRYVENNRPRRLSIIICTAPYIYGFKPSKSMPSLH
jgi:hypothetical protein